MKSLNTLLALLGMFAAIPAWAQAQPADPASRSSRPQLPADGAATAPAAADGHVVKAEVGVAERKPSGDPQPPATALPTDPLKPYLLTKSAGPFMLLARVFRGTDCERRGLALVTELRAEFGLPAYIIRVKDLPDNPLMRGVPPAAPGPGVVPANNMGGPVRNVEEVAVLIGNEKTRAGQEMLWRDVQEIQPRCLEDSPFWWRTDLRTARRTTNPLLGAIDLFRPARETKQPLAR